VTEIFCEFTFEAAHRLPNLPKEHKCHRMHGHNYKVAVYLRGDVDSTTQWVLDFGAVRDVFDTLVFVELDHRTLNDVEGLENPTAEVIARWIYDRLTLAEVMRGLDRVIVYELPTCGATYKP